MAQTLMLTWLATYAAQFLDLYKILSNGGTGCDITTGHRLENPAVPGGDNIHFRIAQGKG